jgi:hypothetical protein
MAAECTSPPESGTPSPPEASSPVHPAVDPPVTFEELYAWASQAVSPNSPLNAARTGGEGGSLVGVVRREDVAWYCSRSTAEDSADECSNHHHLRRRCRCCTSATAASCTRACAGGCPCLPRWCTACPSSATTAASSTRPSSSTASPSPAPRYGLTESSGCTMDGGGGCDGFSPLAMRIVTSFLLPEDSMDGPRGGSWLTVLQ